MTIQPDFETFRQLYENGTAQVVWTTLVADLETPVSAMLKLADGRANAFLLESVEGGAVRGRYSIIGLKPDVTWRFYKDKAEINRQARVDQAVDAAMKEGWPIKKIDPVLRAIFRAAGAELFDTDATPPKVVISEFVDVAKAFFPDGKEAGLVNAVLDKVARQARPGPFA